MADPIIEIRDSDNSVTGVLQVSDSEDFPIAINIEISSIQEPTVRSGSWSHEFEVPATKDNNDLLTYIFDTNSTDPAKIKQRKQAILKVEGHTQMRGYIELKSIDYAINGDPVTYRFVSFGDNADWIELLGEKTLRDITWGSHTWDVSTIKTQWQDFDDDNSQDYVYPVINYGRFTGIDLDDNQKFVLLEDLRPALRLRRVVRQSLEDVGYTLVSDFLDGNNSDLDATRLILPFVGDGFNLGQAAIDAGTFAADIISNTDFNDIVVAGSSLANQNNTYSINSSKINDSDANTIVFGNETDISANYDDTTGIFSGFTGQAKFSSELEITYKSSGFHFNDVLSFELVKQNGNNITVLDTFVVGLVNLIGQYNKKVSFPSLESPVINLTSSDQVYVRFYLFDTVSGTGSSRNLDVRIKKNSSFENEVAAAMPRGATINIEDVVPDLQQADIILGLKNIFNLYYKTDPYNKKVFIEPRDAFYKSLSNAIDWTDKLDVRTVQKVSIIKDYKKDILFKYKEDSRDGYVVKRNEWAKDFYGITDSEYASELYSLSNRFERGVQEIEAQEYSPTYAIEDDVNYFSVAKVKFGTGKQYSRISLARMWKEHKATDNPPDNFYDFAPRLLYYKYIDQFPSDTGGEMLFDDGTGSSYNKESKIPAATFGATKQQNDLGYERLAFSNGQDYSGSKIKGLVEKFYGKQLKIVEKGLVITARFNLTNKDISEIDLRTPIYLDRPANFKGYYVIDRIKDFTPTRQKLTEVQLIKVENFEPVAITPVGVDTNDDEIDVKNDDNVKDAKLRYGKLPQHNIGNVKGSPSYVIGSKSDARKGGDSLALGKGVISTGFGQQVFGQFNKPSETDKMQLGLGEDNDTRRNVLSVDEDLRPKMYGGRVLINDGGVVQEVVLENADESITPVLIDDNKL